MLSTGRVPLVPPSPCTPCPRVVLGGEALTGDDFLKGAQSGSPKAQNALVGSSL